MKTFSIATLTHALQSDIFDEAVKDGRISYIVLADNEIALTYSYKGQTVILTNRIKEIKLSERG